MESSRRNRVITVDKETLGTLTLIQSKILGNCSFLMDENDIEEALKSGSFMKTPMPNPFIFAPKDKKIQNLIKSSKKDEIFDISYDGKIVGQLKSKSSFKVKSKWKESSIFSLNLDCEIGKYGLSGTFEIYNNRISEAKKQIQELKKELNLKKITALILGADPFHRAHERLIRMTIDKADLVIIFLIENVDNDSLSFELREEMIDYFAKKFLPRNKIVVVPLENTYIFSGHKNPKLECMIAKNFGATKMVIGQNHGSIGMYFDDNQSYSILDKYKDIVNLEILIVPEFVYCNECRTIVSTKTCPHGPHHHIKYRTQTLRALLNEGILPPAILMRREISAIILSRLFPNRFENLQTIHNDLFPNKGLLEEHSQRDFYEELMLLYQTSSLT